MSVTRRARSATRWSLKMQRRIALTQVFFWPTLVVTVGVLAGGSLVVLRKRSAGVAEPVPAPRAAAATA